MSALRLASCGDDGVRIWLADGTAIPLPTSSDEQHGSAPRWSSPATVTRWFPSGKILTAGTRAGSVTFYHHETLAFLSEMRAPTGDGDRDLRTGKACAVSLNAIDVSNGSRFLATGSSDGTLAVWDMKSRSIESRFKEGASITAVSFQRTSDSRYVACARANGISLYSRISGRLVNQFYVSAAAEVNSGSLLVTAMGFSPILTNVLVVADNYGAVTVWDISRVKPLAPGITTSDSNTPNAPVLVRFPSPEDCMPASDIAFCPKAGPFSFGVSYLDKKISLFSIESRRLTHVISCSSPLTSLAVALDGHTIAAGSATGSIYMYRLSYQGSRITHEDLLTIENAHKSVSLHDFPTSTAAVYSLHFQPMQISPSQFSSRSRSSQAPAPVPESITTTSHSSRVDDATDEKPRSRESALFSPLAKVASSRYHRENSAPRFRVSRESDIIPATAQVEKPLQNESDPHLEAQLQDVPHENTFDGALSFQSIQSLSSDIAPSEHDDEADAVLSEIPPSPADLLDDDVKLDSSNEKKTELSDTTVFQRPPVGQLKRSSSECNQDISRDFGTMPVRSFSAGAKGDGLEMQGNVATTKSPTEDASRLNGISHSVSDEKALVRSAHAHGPVGLRRPPAGRMTRSTSELEHVQKREDSLPPRSLSANDKLSTRAPYSACRTGLVDSTTQSNLREGELPKIADLPNVRKGVDSAGVEDPSVKTPHEDSPAQITGSEFPENSTKPNSGEGGIHVEENIDDSSNGNHIVSSSGLFDPFLKDNKTNSTIPPSSESLAENMRQLLRQEMNVLREDMRSDLLNLHRELVLSFAHQEQHFQELLANRDEKLEALEKQLRDLRDESKVTVPASKANLSDWM